MTEPGNRRVNDKIKKMLFENFKSLGFEIEFVMNKKVVEYLDVELNLQTVSVSPYMKHKIK